MVHYLYYAQNKKGFNNMVPKICFHERLLVSIWQVQLFDDLLKKVEQLLVVEVDSLKVARLSLHLVHRVTDVLHQFVVLKR